VTDTHSVCRLTVSEFRHSTVKFTKLFYTLMEECGRTRSSSGPRNSPFQ